MPPRRLACPIGLICCRQTMHFGSIRARRNAGCKPTRRIGRYRSVARREMHCLLSSPRKRGPMNTGVFPMLHELIKTEASGVMGPRLRGDDKSLGTTVLLRACAAATFASLTLLAPTLVSAQSIAHHFRGKTIRLLVPSAPGGDRGLYPVVFAPFFSKHIPGNPAVQPVFMPGAGG